MPFQKNNELNPYVATGYLFVNSLPIEDIRNPYIYGEKGKKTF